MTYPTEQDLALVLDNMNFIKNFVESVAAQITSPGGNNFKPLTQFLADIQSDVDSVAAIVNGYKIDAEAAATAAALSASNAANSETTASSASATAVTKAAEANVDATNAETHATTAETAKQLVLSDAGDIFETIAQGLAATANNDVFKVVNTANSLIYADVYKNDNGVEQFVDSLPNYAAFQNMETTLTDHETRIAALEAL